MKNLTQVPVMKMQVASITCDRCGKLFETCNRGSFTSKDDPSEIHEFSINCGYDSKIHDGAIIQFQICDDCLMDIFSSFNNVTILNVPQDERVEITDRISAKSGVLFR